MCPMFDDVTALSKYQYTLPTVMRILLSCVFALGVNISNYLVLGKTSPLTYQVLGHLKTILILILGMCVWLVCVWTCVCVYVWQYVCMDHVLVMVWICIM